MGTVNNVEKITIGIVGTGFVTKAMHLPGIAQSKKGMIKGLFDIKHDLAEDARKSYLALLKKSKNPFLDVASKETKVYDSLAAMIDEVDVVDICTPPKFHLENLKAAVDAGKHVICEKPLERNWWAVNEYFDTFQATKAKDIKFVLHTNPIWNPLVKVGRDLLASSVVGEIELIRTIYQGTDPKHTVNLPGLWDKFLSGGGALMDIGPHPYSSMWYWLGSAYKPVSVEAKLLAARVPVRTICGKAGTKVTVEDDAHITITWQNETGHTITGELEATWNKRDWTNDMKLGGPSNLNYEVRGTDGILTFPNVIFNFTKPIGFGACYVIVGKDGSKKAVKFPIPKPKIEDALFFDDFMDVVNGDAEPRNNLEFAEDMLKVFGASYLSRKLHKQVSLDEYTRYATSIAGKIETPEDQVKSIINDLFEDF